MEYLNDLHEPKPKIAFLDFAQYFVKSAQNVRIFYSFNSRDPGQSIPGNGKNKIREFPGFPVPGIPGNKH